MAALSERTRDDPLNPRVIVDNQNPPRRHVRALGALSHFSGELARDDCGRRLAPGTYYSSSLPSQRQLPRSRSSGLGRVERFFSGRSRRGGPSLGRAPGAAPKPPGLNPPGARGGPKSLGGPPGPPPGRGAPP